MIDYPKNIQLNTPLGKVILAVTSGDHIYVDGGSNGGSLTVNNVDVACSLHLNLKDGKWQSSHIYASRKGVGKEPSDVAKKKLEKVLTESVVAYIKENEHLLYNGERYALTSKRDSLQKEVSDRRTELDKLEKELRHLEEKLFQMTDSGSIEGEI